MSTKLIYPTGESLFVHSLSVFIYIYIRLIGNNIQVLFE